MITHPFWDDACDMHEAAALLEVSSLYLRGVYRELNVPHERFCGRVIFRKSEVLEWKAKREAKRRQHEERGAMMSRQVK